MFHSRVEVRFRFRGTSQIKESCDAAKWIQKKIDEEIGTWKGPDPLLLQRLKGKRNATIQKIDNAFNEALEECSEWRRYRELRKEAFEKFNGGHWLPIHPRIEVVGQ